MTHRLMFFAAAVSIGIPATASAGVTSGAAPAAGSYTVDEASPLADYEYVTDVSSSSSWLTFRAPETTESFDLDKVHFVWFDPLGWCDANIRLYEYDDPVLGTAVDPSLGDAMLLTSEDWLVYTDGITHGTASVGDHVEWDLDDLTLSPGKDYALYVSQSNCYLGLNLYAGFVTEEELNPRLDVVEGTSGLVTGWTSPLSLACTGGTCPEVGGGGDSGGGDSGGSGGGDCVPSDYEGAPEPTSATTSTGATWTYDAAHCDAAEKADTVYETTVSPTYFTGGARYRGNVYTNTLGGTLDSFDIRLDLGASTCDVTFQVHSRDTSASSSDPSAWDLVHSGTVRASIADQWHSSGDIDLTLVAGQDYALGAYWDCTASYYYDFGRLWETSSATGALGSLAQRWYGVTGPEIAYTTGEGEYTHRYHMSGPGSRVGIHWQMSPSLTGSSSTAEAVEVIDVTLDGASRLQSFSQSETAAWMSTSTGVTHLRDGSATFWTDNRYSAVVEDERSLSFAPEYRYLGTWYDSEETTVDVCTEECTWSGDGVCDDGGSGSSYSVCDLGSDCSDCGTRQTTTPGASYATTLTRRAGEACFMGQWDTAPGIAHIPISAFGLAVETTGCTHVDADNFDAGAEVDDGSCVFSCRDCVVAIPVGAESSDCADGDVVADGGTCTWIGGTGYTCTNLGVGTCSDGVFSPLPSCTAGSELDCSNSADDDGDTLVDCDDPDCDGNAVCDVTCPDGQHDDGGVCVDNVCSCEFGDPAVGSACETHEATQCLTCFTGYELDGSGDCVESTSSPDPGGSGGTTEGTVPALPAHGYLFLAGMFLSVGSGSIRRRERKS